MREFIYRLWRVSVCLRACVCALKIKVFSNPALDSEDGELLISASILIRRLPPPFFFLTHSSSLIFRSSKSAAGFAPSPS